MSFQVETITSSEATDVATPFTGTWLLDLNASHSQNLKTHGVDIGDSLFQTSPELNLLQHDVCKPFPESLKWKNSFDLVHQRWLVWGIPTSDWQAVVHNLVDVVKPNGHIQFVETQWVLEGITNDQPEQQKLNKVQEWSCSSAGLDLHIWNRLEDLLRNEGFVDLEVISFDLGYGATAKRAQDRIWTAELLPESFRHLAHQMKEDGIPGVAETEGDYFLWMDNLVLELKSKGYTPKLKWICGRKPQ